jgi:hypothetical protein
MNISIAASSQAIQTSFKKLEFADNGLILECRKNKKKSIPFEEIETVYIKSHSIHPLLEFGLILAPFLFLFLIIDYVQLQLLFIFAIIAIFPVVAKVINYKWYSLKVRLKDGSLFIKNVSSRNKSDYFSILNKYCKDSHHYFTNIYATAS